MKIISFESLPTQRITMFNSQRCSSKSFARGQGQSHIHYIDFQKNSIIGPHIAGFGQLFVVIAGGGWVAGMDDLPHSIQVGQAAYFQKGERHSKGSDSGMSVVMIQVEDLKVD